jgi:hypothetical protein
MEEPIRKLLESFWNRKGTVFTEAHYWAYPEKHEPSPCPHNPIYLRFALILFFHQRLGLQSGIFRSGFPTVILYAIVHVFHITASLAWSPLGLVKSADFQQGTIIRLVVLHACESSCLTSREKVNSVLFLFQNTTIRRLDSVPVYR